MSTQSRLRTFPGLQRDQFMHPWDTQAQKALRAVPGLDLVLRKFMEYGIERLTYLNLVASSAEVNARMFPRIARYTAYGCRVLDLPMPKVYVSTDPFPNAFTIGETTPVIVLSSGLVDLMDDRELSFVIGHELGHIKCQHVLYGMVARNLSVLLEYAGDITFGAGRLVGSAIALPLYDWFRKAELSADRAGLLCVQDVEVAMSALMKLAAGSRRLFDEMDIEEFIRQARTYEDVATNSALNRLYRFLLTAWKEHPVTVMRAHYLDEWHTSGEYGRLTLRQIEDSSVPPCRTL